MACARTRLNAGAFALFTLAAAAAAAFSYLNVPVFFCDVRVAEKSVRNILFEKKFLRFYRRSSTTFFRLQLVMLPAA
jgi:hypothetical protein